MPNSFSPFWTKKPRIIGKTKKNKKPKKNKSGTHRRKEREHRRNTRNAEENTGKNERNTARRNTEETQVEPRTKKRTTGDLSVALLFVRDSSCVSSVFLRCSFFPPVSQRNTLWEKKKRDTPLVEKKTFFPFFLQSFASVIISLFIYMDSFFSIFCHLRLGYGLRVREKVSRPLFPLSRIAPFRFSRLW